jgi:hypothetical protein
LFFVLKRTAVPAKKKVALGTGHVREQVIEINMPQCLQALSIDEQNPKRLIQQVKMLKT